MPVMIFKRVVFPEPFAPTSATFCLLSMLKDTPLKTGPVTNAFEILFTLNNMI